jgi:hypothetical protein
MRWYLVDNHEIYAQTVMSNEGGGDDDLDFGSRCTGFQFQPGYVTVIVVFFSMNANFGVVSCHLTIFF